MGKLFWKIRFVEERHSSDDELLLYLDGELTVKEAGWVRAHLEGCWSCRMRAEKIQEAISSFVEFRDRVRTPELPPPPCGWRTFESSLGPFAGATEASVAPSRWQALFDSLGRLFFRPQQLIRLAAGLLLAALAVWAVIRSQSVPVVSANELLQAAMKAQANEVRSVAQPVVYQKLLVRRRVATREEALVWEIWNESAKVRFRQCVNDHGNRHFVSTEVQEAPALLSELQRVFQTNRLDWRRPLSPSAYQAWRQTVVEKREAVSAGMVANGLPALTVTTVPQHVVEIGGIVEASLVVRARDWHPLEQRLRIRREGGEWEYRLAETAFEVINAETLHPSFFTDPASNALAPVQAGRAELSALEPALLDTGLQPTNTDLSAALDDAETEVRYALHRAGGDLGEPIEIIRQPSGKLEVRGLVNTAKRKQELDAVLRTIPNVTVNLKTVEEATRSATAGPVSAEEPSSEGRLEVGGGALPLGEMLAQRQKVNDEEIKELSNTALALSEAALAEAWALRRLAERYTPAELARLNPQSRRKLTLIVRDHLKALRGRIESIRALLTPALQSVAGDRPESAPSVAWETSWPAFSAPLFKTLQRMNRLTSALCATAPIEKFEAARIAQYERSARELLSHFSVLEAQLPRLEKQAAGEFPSEPSTN